MRTAFLSSYKNIIVIFALVKTSFFICHFSLNKMADSKTLKISTGTIVKNLKC